jgi:SAM-dependent methyltransferase
MGGRNDQRVCLEGGRLVYYRPNMGRCFWDEHWRACNSPQFYGPYLRGYLGRGSLAKVLRRRLPRTGRILEAGCGKAQYVVSLRARGYDCIGIDNAKDTIGGVRRLFPKLPIVCGDVCRLPYEDRSFTAYLSFGVVEHFIEGPGPALCEAHRVLANEGLLIISVPQLFPWRLREVCGPPLAAESSFYQYAFPPEEFANLLEEEGFTVEEQYVYGSEFALQLRWPRFGKLFASFPRLATAVGLALDATPSIWSRCGRMRLYVARKK